MPPEVEVPEVDVIESLTPEMAAHAHRVVAAATAADGVAPLSEQAVLAIDGAGVGVRHVISAAGYANIVAGRDDEPAMIEAVVDPEQRRRGHGRALLETAFTAARERAGAAPTSDAVRAWAHGDLPAAQALAASLGLQRRRELLQLRRTGGADGLPALDVPADIELRTYAGSSDDAEILRVNNAAFAWHPEQGGWAPEQITERVASDWFDPAGLFLAFDAAAGAGESDRRPLLGFHWTKTQGPGLGEVYVVGVDPAAQGRGLGRLLTLAGLHYFAERGVDEVLLYVEGDNTAAQHTYERLGFTRYAIDVAYG
ncbi:MULTISPECIES: mycothiol synthase [unclassified Gordonia (in: high G+C Gram-positive bacteria)]|uniref:mycothiol synthase n=1 Tax=unclassified Gordonia (in: high G+C Gram-positive bacteria) TaxID=2657482 RepID=UPI0009AEEB94|nr:MULTISPECIES: mycothiol synthase [unclassified Gordonia (in: high G+C Gram-positive bacteria)]MDF3282682.1 mycothiol synthase [Gordonia sp. N1V]OPX13791.1 mycothiol synthase [Gordonia sp. i37]